jgi:sarcosine oxidase subunit delta
MQHFNCPWCGTRPQTEFRYQRAAENIPRGWPEPLHAQLARLTQRTNPAGRHEELWQHAGGCRGWLIVQRDTLTHEVSGVRAVPEQA